LTVLKLVTDENFNNNIYRGIIRRNPDIDIVRIQDCGLAGASDSEVLAYAAEEDRVLLTHDVETVTKCALKRINKNLYLPGVIEVSQKCSTTLAIEQITMTTLCLQPDEIKNQIIYIPL